MLEWRIFMLGSWLNTTISLERIGTFSRGSSQRPEWAWILRFLSPRNSSFLAMCNSSNLSTPFESYGYLAPSNWGARKGSNLNSQQNPDWLLSFLPPSARRELFFATSQYIFSSFHRSLEMLHPG